MTGFNWDAIWQWMQKTDLVTSLLFFGGGLLASFAVHLVFRAFFHKLVKKTESEYDDQLVQRLHRPVVFTVLCIGLFLTIEDLNLPAAWSFRFTAVVKTFLGLVWAFSLINILRLFILALKRRRRGDSVFSQTLPLLQNVFKVVIFAATGIWLLDLWRINITPLMASAGIATAAVALAAKDTLANFFGGLSIMIDRPYRLGDYVVMENGDRGEVVQIGIRSTRILTRDDVQITIPNALMANARIVNQTAPAPRFRVRSKVGISYNADPDQAERVMLAAIEDVEQLLKIPKPRARFREFGNSSLNFEVLAWVADPADRGLAEHNMNRKIFYALKEAGIEIPFPQRVVHIIKETPTPEE